VNGFGWACVLTAILWVGCSDEAEKSVPQKTPKPASSSIPAARPATSPAPSAAAPDQPDTRSQAELIEAGRAAYNANCIACHNMDPRQPGAIGPAVAGSSLELIEARVMRAEYPPGYVPKRNTRVMIALPHLKPRLGELAAYLGSLD
jgi:mono/diheme cytochrome c family protein